MGFNFNDETILDEEEKIKEQLKNDDTIDLARALAEYIQNWNITINDDLKPLKKDRFEYLKLVSEVKSELKDLALSKAIEQRLFVDFKLELEKNGMSDENSSYVKRFYNLGNILHDYNLSLEEKANYKEDLYLSILDAKPNMLEKLDFSRDNLNNIFYNVFDEQEIIGTKKSLTEYFNLEKQMAGEIYKTQDTAYLKQMTISKLNSNIEKLQESKTDGVMIIRLNQEGEMKIFDEEDTIFALEANVKTLEKEQKSYEEEM